MHESILDKRFAIKAIPIEDRRPAELSSIMKPHPLSYMELPFDPEYSLYNNRMTPERLITLLMMNNTGLSARK